MSLSKHIQSHSASRLRAGIDWRACLLASIALHAGLMAMGSVIVSGPAFVRAANEDEEPTFVIHARFAERGDLASGDEGRGLQRFDDSHVAPTSEPQSLPSGDEGRGLQIFIDSRVVLTSDTQSLASVDEGRRWQIFDDSHVAPATDAQSLRSADIDVDARPVDVHALAREVRIDEPSQVAPTRAPAANEPAAVFAPEPEPPAPIVSANEAQHASDHVDASDDASTRSSSQAPVGDGSVQNGADSMTSSAHADTSTGATGSGTRTSENAGSGARASENAGLGGSGAASHAPTSSLVLTFAPRPEYPSASRRLGEEGDVSCCLHIARDGHVAAVEVLASSGHPRLDRAAVLALERWLFEPLRGLGPEGTVKLAHKVAFQLK